MSTTQQIRFTKTFEISEMLQDIKVLYKGLSESELCKLALSKMWTTEIERDENGFTLRQQKELSQAIEEVDRGEGLIGPFKGAEAVKFLDSVSQ